MDDLKEEEDDLGIYSLKQILMMILPDNIWQKEGRKLRLKRLLPNMDKLYKYQELNM